MLLAADAAKKEATVRRVCEPILAKKAPPLPKKEEPAAPAAAEGGEAADAGGEEMETEAGPPRPPTDEGEPMEA